LAAFALVAPARPAVVLVAFGGVARRGLLRLLADGGCDVTRECACRADLDEALAEPVDAVVLDLDRADCPDDARRVAALRPDVRVVACSPSRPAMRVLHGDGLEAHDRPLSAETLVRAVRGGA
jgi:hypothetical protein